mgnify:CR=1 FL=1
MPPQTFNLKLEYRIFAAIKRMNKYNKKKKKKKKKKKNKNKNKQKKINIK